MADGDLHGLLELASQQHGVLNVDQAARHGIGRRRLQRAVDRGWLTPMDGLTSVYSVAGSRPSWRQQAAALTLARPGAALSHGAAGALHGLQDEPPTYELNLARGTAPLPGVRCRWRQLAPEDRTIRDGIACTGVERTILDLWRARTSITERDELLAAASAAGIDLDGLHAAVNRLGSYRATAARSLAFAARRRAVAERSRAAWADQFCEARDALGLPRPERVDRLTDGEGRPLAGSSLLLRPLRVVVTRHCDRPGQQRLLVAHDVRLLGRGWLVARFDERHSPHAAAAALAEVARRSRPLVPGAP